MGRRFYERLQPDEAITSKLTEDPRTRETITELLTETVDRVSTFRTGFLALLELRLEATRRPELQAVLTERVRDDLTSTCATIGRPAFQVTKPRCACSAWR